MAFAVGTLNRGILTYKLGKALHIKTPNETFWIVFIPPIEVQSLTKALWKFALVEHLYLFSLRRLFPLICHQSISEKSVFHQYRNLSCFGQSYFEHKSSFRVWARTWHWNHLSHPYCAPPQTTPKANLANLNLRDMCRSRLSYLEQTSCYLAAD